MMGMDGWKVFTEYEVGRAMSLIEWVARGGKHIAELTSRSTDDPGSIRDDLQRCIADSGLHVKGFLMETEPTVWSCGFFSKPWAVDAFASLYRTGESFSLEENRHWIAGLLFGYSSSAIGRFVSGSHEPESTSLQYDTGRMVETFPLATVRSHNCSGTSASATTLMSGISAQLNRS